jgi:hypothetical protein
VAPMICGRYAFCAIVKYTVIKRGIYSQMNDLKVFISHRHDDVEIVNVISDHLKEWGVDKDSIFQSTDPSNGLTPGNNIKDELEEKLTKVNLLLLIYTDNNADWSYCMWECGIAQGKSTVPTRTVVFQCTSDEPTVFQNELRIDVRSLIEIQRFVETFHKQADFIPGNENSNGLYPDISDEIMLKRSERFFGELNEVVPPGTFSSRHMWDFIRLRLDSSNVTNIENEGNKEKKLLIIKEHLEILEPKYPTVGGSVDTAIKQFGFVGYTKELKMHSIIDRWIEEDSTGNDAWVYNIYEAIYQSLTNSQSVPLGNIMKSVRINVDWWFLPVITRMRSYSDNSREFDLYLVQVEYDKAIFQK